MSELRQKGNRANKGGNQPVSGMPDVIVAGGGISGLTLSCLLAGHGVRTVCIDRDDPAAHLKESFDGRTMAISFGSRKVLEAAGLWRGLSPQACPIRDIRILDSGSPCLLNFLSDDTGEEAFGWIIDIRLIRKALFERIAALSAARHLAPAQITDFSSSDEAVTVRFGDGAILSAPLLAACDGRASFVREALDIPSRRWSYDQRAIVCTVVHEHPHNNIAIEHFRSDGPFAILPMTGDEKGRHRSSVVWTAHGKAKKSALDYDEETFNAGLNALFPAEYGEVKLTGQRWSYPLGLIHAHRYIAPRMALVADAAHGIHPIAGQGLNLGLRDVAALAELVIAAVQKGEDPGGMRLLEEYQRARRFDNMAMAGATDMLNRIFASRLPGMGLLRRAGLRVIERTPPAKRFFMKQAMGAAGLLPRLVRDGKL